MSHFAKSLFAAALEASASSLPSFTCLMAGRVSTYERSRPRTSLVADALFANGVNQIIWHGKPHSKGLEDSINFYASVPGDDGPLSKELPAFNQYLGKDRASYSKGMRTQTLRSVFLPKMPGSRGNAKRKAVCLGERLL